MYKMVSKAKQQRQRLFCAILLNRTYAKLRWLGAQPQTVQLYGKAKQQRQRLFCVSFIKLKSSLNNTTSA